MKNIDRYTRAMVAGQLEVCVAIEQKHGLYGYPPDIVCVGLRAADEGRSVDDAVDAYINGEPEQTK